MQPTDIRNVKVKISRVIEHLSPSRLKIALDFLEYLQEKEDDDEIISMLNDPALMEDYRQAKEDILSGQTISWEEIKRHV